MQQLKAAGYHSLKIVRDRTKGCFVKGKMKVPRNGIFIPGPTEDVAEYRHRQVKLEDYLLFRILKIHVNYDFLPLNPQERAQIEQLGLEQSDLSFPIKYRIKLPWNAITIKHNATEKEGNYLVWESLYSGGEGVDIQLLTAVPSIKFIVLLLAGTVSVLVGSLIKKKRGGVHEEVSE